jgi:hypothetical protein
MTLPAETRADAFGTLTDEAFVRSRRRLGVPRPQVNPPHNYEVTWDGVRHFVYGYGDDNPLYCDPDYAAGTRLGAAGGTMSYREVARVRCCVERGRLGVESDWRSAQHVLGEGR